MANSFIQVSEPIDFKAHQHLFIHKNQHKMFCLLKGKLKMINGEKILSGGDDFGLEHILNLEPIEEDFEVLEDATIIAIETMTMHEPKIMNGIINNIVDYIREVREKLLKGTTSCRP